MWTQKSFKKIEKFIIMTSHSIIKWHHKDSVHIEYAVIKDLPQNKPKILVVF